MIKDFVTITRPYGKKKYNEARISGCSYIKVSFTVTYHNFFIIEP